MFDPNAWLSLTFRRMRRVCVLILALVVFSWSEETHAQDDDLLVPLTPSDAKKKQGTVKKRKNGKSRKDSEAQGPVGDPGFLTVKVTGAKGAKLFVDDQEMGVLPTAAIPVSPGIHNVTIKRSGFADFTRTVSVKSGATTEVNATLEATGGTLVVESVPEGANVFVDGQASGQTPVHDVVLPTGTYELKVAKEGYREEISRVSIRTGKEQLVRLSLRPLTGDVVAGTSNRSLVPTGLLESNDLAESMEVTTQATPAPWYGRWYVWAGAAAVAVGATVAIVSATSRPGRDSLPKVCEGFTPGVTCGQF
jgi:hypothetical protein